MSATATDHPHFDTLDEALSAFDIDPANRTFVEHVVDRIGIKRYSLRSGYLRADRSAGGLALNIHAGYTTGFASEEEARNSATAGARVFRSDRGKAVWGLDHPITGHDRARHNPEIETATCPTCFTQLPTTKVCYYCE